MDLDAVSAADFNPHIGSAFLIRFTDGEYTLRLAEVTEQPALGWPGSSRSPFSLVFSGPAQPILRQGTYLLQHDVLGDLTLFIVPIQPDSSGSRYEAVFN